MNLIKKTATMMALSALSLTTLTSEAKVAVNAMFTDNMILQREMDVPIWGTADPGETVVVEFAPQKNTKAVAQKVTTRADEDGKWRLAMKPLSASRIGARLIITGDKTKGPPTELKGVLVGEVWLGSGQSNMAYGTRHYTKGDPNLKKACEGGPYPMLRVYVKGAWKIADAESINNFSALLFSFGHALQKELDVPVGLMCGARNGSPSASWLTEEMAGASPELVKMFKEKSGFKSLEAMNADRLEKLAQFKIEKERVQKEEKSSRRMRFSHPATVTGQLYRRDIQRLVPYAIRGVLWDQGESGTSMPGVDQYTLMNALIKGWRKEWNRADLPFLHIQKPSGGGCAWDDDFPAGSKAPLKWVPLPQEPLPDDRSCARQLVHIKMATLKNAPLVTTSDLTPGTHPPTKYSYGKRACRVALGTVYGRDIVTCGPVYQSHTVRSDEIEVKFDNVGKGIAFRHGNKLQGFEIAGDDLKWQWADARIKGNAVIVSSSKIKTPRHVRYAFYKTFNWANLFNKDGLPALMFTTSPR
jgi:sialate O-acetylesterase